MSERQPRNVEGISLVQIGTVRRAPDLAAGVEAIDAAGEAIVPIGSYLHHLIANGCSPQTCRSYALALLRWWRFLAAVEIDWTQAHRAEFVDYIVWMRSATPRRGGRSASRAGYSPRTINHSCAVLSGFYEFHLERGTGPEVNPTTGNGPRLYAHHNPMRPYARSGRLVGRQKIPRSAPKSIPDEVIDELFVKLRHDRDRAIVELFLSTGARASELLAITGSDLDFGNARIEVERKGGRERQWLPASPDAFVWLRLYLGQRRLSPHEPVWRTLREPERPLNYPAFRQVFIRAQRELGTRYTLHQLRHTASYRMVEDPEIPLTDVQWVLGHSFLSSTQIYVQARPADVLARMAEHHRRPRPQLPAIPLAVGYDSDALATLFGTRK